MKIVLLRIQHFYPSKWSLHWWHNWILAAIYFAIFKYKIYKNQMFRIWVLCAWVLKPWECLLKICFKRISDSKVAQILTFFILLIKWGASTYDKAWTVDRNSHFWSVLKVISNVTLFPKHRYFTFPLPLKLSAFLTCLECVLNVIFQLLSKQAIIHVQGGVEIILYLFQLLVCVGLLFWFLLGRISQNPPRSILILKKLAFKKEKKKVNLHVLRVQK